MMANENSRQSAGVLVGGLFVSDGFDGVHVGSFLGRDVAEEDADEHTDEE